MLDAYIIEKLKQEQEQQRDQHQWQPLPLPLEEYDPWERPEPPRKKEEEKDVPRGVTVLELESAIATSHEITLIAD